LTQIVLSELRFGHEYPGASLNSRTTGRLDGVEKLAASIAAKGVIEPLVVVWRPVDEGDPAFRANDDDVRLIAPYVVDGNRRLAALRLLAERGDFSFDEPVDVVVRDEVDSEAIETSLIANLEREPLHPVDEYEAFATLARAGYTDEAIARRFGLDPRDVRQRLALGKLTPVVRQAWRDDRLSAADAQAFAAVDDQDLQARAYDALVESKAYVSRHSIFECLGAEVSGRDLKFVGEDAYLAAGGRIAEDLFASEEGRHRLVLDKPVLQALVLEKLAAACEKLVAEGWSWATPQRDAPDGVWSWERIRAEDDDDGQAVYTATDKGRSGCIVSHSFEGELTVLRGFVTPGIAATDSGVAARDDANSEDDKAEPRKVVDALRDTLTAALGAAVAKSYRGAMSALLATLLMGDAKSPLRIVAKPSIHAAGQLCETLAEFGAQVAGTFAERLTYVDRLSDPQRNELFRLLIGAAIDVGSKVREEWGASALEADRIEPLAAAVQHLGLLDLTRQAFDADGYFAGAPKGFALMCLTESLGEAEATKWANKRKGDLAAHAAEVARQKGWLPPALRTSDYACAPTPLADRAADARDNVGRKRAARKAQSESTDD
jgi:ParB family chromosome partitioning protein